MKSCSKCGGMKAAEEYRKGSRQCRACRNTASREWNRAHRDYGKRWERTHLEQSRASSKAWREANPERCRAWERRSHLKQYGLTTEQFTDLLARQGGGCAICLGPANGKGGTFHVDHDHSTGAVRGLLCHGCNTALGLTGECVDRLEKLIAYLMRHREVQGVA